jgi:C1A family cysteine protease
MESNLDTRVESNLPAKVESSPPVDTNLDSILTANIESKTLAPALVDSKTSRVVDTSMHCVAGALRSPADFSDGIYEYAGFGLDTQSAGLPDILDLREYSRPSRDQGDNGTCAAHVGATIREMQIHRRNGSCEPLSPLFIYYCRSNSPGVGMFGRNVFHILRTIGTIPESIYDYGVEPTVEMMQLAAKYKIKNYARVISMYGLKRAIWERGPCYMQLPLYGSHPYFWRPSKADCYGGHAVTVVGYNLEGFILKNSWGAEWNGDGCVVFPYSDWGAQWECWAAIDGDNDSPRKTKSRKCIVM